MKSGLSWRPLACLVLAAIWPQPAPAQAPALAQAIAPAQAIEWLGESVVPRQLEGSKAPVGGLSGLAYDPERGLYYAISDDRSQFGPARTYELAIDLDLVTGRLGAVAIEGEIELRRADGSAFPFDSIDPESLARTPQGTWVIASEGRAELGVAAALLEFDAAGREVGQWRLPRRFRPRRRAGIRNNLALESATLSPGGQWLFTATENALVQDGPVATAENGSASRLLRFDRRSRRLAASYIYTTEPIAAAPTGEEFAVNGLVDLLALGEHRLLALERSFTAGQGNVARLFVIDLEGASDISRVRRLTRRRGLVPAAKSLLLDLADLGVTPDNLEGMALGPRLADGRCTLMLIADDNFNPATQRSQVLALALPCTESGGLTHPPATVLN